MQTILRVTLDDIETLSITDKYAILEKMPTTLLINELYRRNVESENEIKALKERLIRNDII